MLHSDSIIDNFKKVVEGKIKLSTLCMIHGVKKSWIYELYNRYKEGKKVLLKKGHRKKRLTEEWAIVIQEKYKELIIKDGNKFLYPSMQILKNIVESEHINIPSFSIETYRKCVKELEIYPVYQKKPKRYRKRFEAEAVGLLIQGDVTEYNWIEGALPFKLLMFIDDHSRYVLYADFIERDDLESHIKALKEVIKTYGKPKIIYYDNDSKYRKKVMEKALNPTLVNGLKEIGIEVINSTPYMPQGKGKIERKFQTFQRQLIFWFKHKKIKTWEEARECLKWYVEQHNNTYSRAINTTPQDRFFNSDKDVFENIYERDLEKIDNALTKREIRFVDNVNEISFEGKLYKIPAFNGMPLAGKSVEVRVSPNEWIKIFYRGYFLVQYNLNQVEKEDSNGKKVTA